MVSVIVITLNGKAWLDRCLASLRRQTHAPPFDIIVVDNGSTDGTAAHVKGHFPEARLIPLGENTGFCKANNAALQSVEPETRYVALLNHDTEVDPRWLSELVSAMERHPKAGLCASRILLMGDPPVIDTAGDGFSIWGWGYKRGHGQLAHGQFMKEEHTFGACAGAVLYRKSMLDDIGLFDEDFFADCEDTDLNWRAKRSGYECVYVPTAVVRHHMGAVWNTLPGRHREYYTQRNQEWVLLKNVPMPSLMLRLACHAGILPYAWIKAALRGQGGAFLKGKIDAWSRAGEFLQKRRALMRARAR